MRSGGLVTRMGAETATVVGMRARTWSSLGRISTPEFRRLSKSYCALQTIMHLTIMLVLLLPPFIHIESLTPFR